MSIAYIDYEGPQGAHAVINGEMVPASDEVAEALAQNAMLLAVGAAHAAELTEFVAA